MEALQHPFGLEELLDVIRRRKRFLILPGMLILALSAALAFLLPPVYRSEATILIERQSIPTDLIKTTVTGYVQEQIEVIRQRIVTYDNVLKIAEDFDLYPELRKTDPGSAVERIRKDIAVTMVDINASRPDARGSSTLTIAFTVGFAADTPEVAQAVTRQLAARYLEENRKARSRQAAEVSEFLSREADILQEELNQQEQRLAEFKQERMEELPELMSMNLKLYEKTEEEIERTREQIRNLEGRISATEAEMSLTSPFKDIVGEDGKRVLSAGDRLAQLTAEYLRASAKYSAEHPDITRMRHEISVLADQAGLGARTDELLAELISLQEQLAQARQRYGEEHPSVRKLVAAVTAVQNGLQATLVNPAVPASSTSLIPPDNPRFVALKSQLDAAQAALRAERERQVQLQEKLVEYEARLFKTPVAERDFKSLSRDYANNLKKFGELKEKQLQARLAEQLESGDNAERFVLTSPARLPVTPESPNRLGILLLGGFFAVIAGVGAASLAEYLDRSVHGVRGVALRVGAPPLAVIPEIRVATARILPGGRAAAMVALLLSTSAASLHDTPGSPWMDSTAAASPLEEKTARG
ncbi:MAG: Wzz/FepE/Etk N-terminal domain-containing protein [Gammaproteobacteria bacterium]|nr:Wzz/FepE/Etk N-terminal domain-containing protein [Gammaproteobacteria bacterium]